MSHRSWNTLAFILAAFAVTSVVRAQQPNADEAAAVQSGQPQAKQTPTADSVSPSDRQSTPSASAANNSRPAANKPASLTTIVVNGGPSSDILRSARNAGFTMKIANGTTHFCKTEAPIGSRFVSEHCINEEQLTLFLDRTQDQREKLTHILGAPASAP